MCSGEEEKAEEEEDEKKAISKLSFLSPVKGNICRSQKYRRIEEKRKKMKDGYE